MQLPNTAKKTNKRPTYKQFLELIYTRYSSNISYGLERMIGMLEEMDNPEAKIKGIHIAGTNGKGSTSAMCEALSLNDNKTVGLNTSPHLIDYRERFRINGKNITFTEINRVYQMWNKTFDRWQASFFEITTAIAFYCFREQRLDTCIFEVGLGGRLDGTNPFNSTVTIITSISLDHKKTLGDSITKIASEKAGIIKEGIPVVLGKMPDEAFDVINRVAMERKAPLFLYGRDFTVKNVRFDSYGTNFDLHIYSTEIPLPEQIDNLRTNLIGEHQARNASLSLIAYSLYKQHLREEINIDIIRKALLKINWMGRMQIISSKPLTILDCAHNEEGIENLVVNLCQFYPNKRYLFVVAILRDKNFKKMINSMNTIAKKIYIAKNTSERAADAEEQAEVVKDAGIPYSIGSSVVDAYLTAQKEAAPDDIIIITGSIYTVAEVLPLSKKK